MKKEKGRGKGYRGVNSLKAELKKEGQEWLKALVIALILVIVVRTFFISSYVVDGPSMLPTLENGDKLIVNKIGYKVGDFKRFDVIVFHANEHEDYVKRIIGLPGDTVECQRDQLYINGDLIEEPYLEDEKSLGKQVTGDFKVTVPEGKLFVLGDNREDSKDSRYFGFIDSEQVVGKVSLRYWPLNEIKVSF